jgi:arginyl-tRNA synthetase
VHRIASFPGVARAAADMRAPHRVVAYAHELASDYHIFYRDCPVLKAPTPELLRARLALCEAARRTLATCLDLVGVSAPDAM